MEIDIAYIVQVNNFENIYEEKFNEIADIACKMHGNEEDVELSVIFVDDEQIHNINKEYRNIDKSTDVISFALEDSEQFYCPGQPRTLGDIFISIEHANMQAKDYGHSLEREMCFLFTHGILHLLGYDHMEEVEEKIMIEKQKEILEKVQVGR